MTRAETLAYNRGVAEVLALARRTAAALEATSTRPLHDAFAIEALRALADESIALLLPVPAGPEERPRA